MEVLAKNLKPGYFLVGDGRTRLYIDGVSINDGVVTLTHIVTKDVIEFTLDFPENTKLNAARPMEPRLLPPDL